MTVTTNLTGDQDPSNDSKTSSLYVWDESGDWSAGADFPITGGYYLGSAVTYNGSLYTFGGNPDYVTDCYKYDVSGDSWTPIAPLQTGRAVHTAAVVGDFAYVIGGADATANLPTVEKYDFAGNSWSYVASLPQDSIAWGKAVGYTGGPDPLIYLVGGINDAGDALSTVYVYNVTTDTWTTATSVPATVFGGALTILGDKLIYVSGIQDGDLGDNVYIGQLTPGSPTTISWTTAASKYPGVKLGYRTCANKLNETEISEPKPLRRDNWQILHLSAVYINLMQPHGVRCYYCCRW